MSAAAEEEQYSLSAATYIMENLLKQARCNTSIKYQNLALYLHRIWYSKGTT